MKTLNFLSVSIILAITVLASGFKSDNKETVDAIPLTRTNVYVQFLSSSYSSTVTFDFYQNGNLAYSASGEGISIPAGTYVVKVSDPYSYYSSVSFFVSDAVYGEYYSSTGNPATSTPINFSHDGFSVEWTKSQY